MELPVVFSGEDKYTAFVNHFSLDIEDEQQFTEYLDSVGLTIGGFNLLTPEEAGKIFEQYSDGDKDYRELAEDMFDEQVGIQKLVWIQSEEVCSEALDDILGTCDDKDIEKIFGFNPEGSDTSEVVSEVACSFFGQFLAEVHTPVLHLSKSGLRTFSWGYTRMTLILAADIKELTKAALAWAKKEQEEMERKLLEKKNESEGI
jgi:hypothetical protein